MKISNQDIVRTAQELRDEENQQLHVHPWSHRRHFQFPAWIAAIPAAAIIGFFFGVWTNSHIQTGQPLTALVDTVYVTVKDTSTSQDNTQSVSAPLPQRTVGQQVPAERTNKPKHVIHTGQPVINDKIRYDLLVKN